MHHSRGCDGIETLLGGAEVLAHEYEDYDPVAAREAVARSLSAPVGPGPVATGAAAGPAPYPTAHEQARHELDLACALVLNAAEAAASLDRLVDDDRIDPEGALVFGVLLHLTGRGEAAEFWWRFAAGGGSRTAAYCLFLDHRRRGEFRDADHWRGQATRPPAAPHTYGAPARANGPLLLSETARRELLVQWHRGVTPQLPAALERVIDRLHVDCGEGDFGPIPRPSAALSGRIARASP
ncbi:hypothetical protein [Streptantibioticus ferralitis]|uniref:Uncharacterized protein n=1 Tax=Streptantibioticus ferralitis TaxID=236510 RepID=A0ABT5YXG4_9ACTN|nr:hypothetical protein [Streptantibioticus ferralitis]MDF2256287.1 hypothetical protein [Streptantibioticus ferralitis]